MPVGGAGGAGGGVGGGAPEHWRVCKKCGHRARMRDIEKCETCGMDQCPECNSLSGGSCSRCRTGGV